MSQDWVDTLATEFEWADAERGPEWVVAEARDAGIESLEELRARMEEAPSSYSSGDAKWRYSQELHEE